MKDIKPKHEWDKMLNFCRFSKGTSFLYRVLKDDSQRWRTTKSNCSDKKPTVIGPRIFRLTAWGILFSTFHIPFFSVFNFSFSVNCRLRSKWQLLFPWSSVTFIFPCKCPAAHHGTCTRYNLQLQAWFVVMRPIICQINRQWYSMMVTTSFGKLKTGLVKYTASFCKYLNNSQIHNTLFFKFLSKIFVPFW